jgi:hypothetical protein
MRCGDLSKKGCAIDRNRGDTAAHAATRPPLEG